jgi:hypothetical protein
MEYNITAISWWTSTKPMIHLQQKKCATSELNLVHPRNNLGLVHVRKHLSNALPIQNGPKQGDALSYLNLALEYATREAEENQEWMEHKVLVYADVNLLGTNIKYHQRTYKSTIRCYWPVRSKHRQLDLFMSHHQDAEQNQNKENYYHLGCDAIQSGRYIHIHISEEPGTTLLLLDGILRNLMNLRLFRKSVRENSSLIKIRQE